MNDDTDSPQATTRELSASSPTYLPQLDAIRGFAVLLVLWHHWIGPPDGPCGPIGVWIFFVLSGFLITRILLAARRRTPHDNRHALANFYIRRFLRIFPLYYFVLLLSYFASAAFRADWPWYAAYLQNFKMMMAEKDGYVFGEHLWSLAVEEQFYVVWPLVVLFAARFLVLPAIWLAIALAVAVRYIAPLSGWSPFQVYVFTLSNLDLLGWGALLAYFVMYRPERVKVLRRVALCAGVAILIGAGFFSSYSMEFALMPLPTGLIALWAISHAADGIHGLPGRLSLFPPTIYIGRISYGIYIYHYFVPIVLKPVLDRYAIERGTAPFVFVCFTVTMIVSSLSWFFLEKPINSLKHKFAVAGKLRP